MSSGWFDCTEPSLTTSLEGKQSVQGAYALVRVHRTSSKSKTSTHLAFSALRRFEGVEPLGNSVQVPYTSCYHCVDEVREGSVQSNHSELTSKTSTHLAFSALKCFEKG